MVEPSRQRYPIGIPMQPWGAVERAEWLSRQRRQRSYQTDVLDAIDALRGRFDVASYGSVEVGADLLARKRLAVPFDTTSDADPLEEASAARSAIAHALVLQGRGADALAQLAPALDYYRKQQQANAHGTFFRHDFAYALIVSALAHARAS